MMETTDRTEDNHKSDRERRVEFAKRFKSIRKGMPKPTRVINPRKMYDRRDKSWMEKDDNNDNGDNGDN